MRRFAFLAMFMVAPLSVSVAQVQEAGNEASTNADQTFQALIDKCDNTDMLMLRARIRLQLGRTTEAAAATAQSMLDKGFAQCGEGEIEAGKAVLAEALSIAEAGATERLGADESVATEAPAPAPAAEDGAQPAKAWWQIW